MTNHHISPNTPYFAPLLDWQIKAWTQVTTQFYEDRLPHGLLASGMAGIGKRAFVWRLVAWLLCDDKQSHGACGVCDSCTWLAAGTHPDLMVLPSSSLPTALADDKADKSPSIKIDDIRTLQEYSHSKGHGVRLIVLDGAENLTLGAANALLKTLEEPRFGVHLILISDNPTRLLPTIKSRVQTLPLAHIAHDLALNFVAKDLGDNALARLCLDLADGSPLKAVTLPNAPWFAQRLLWLKTWLALRSGQRPPISASDYWQGVLGFTEFVFLTRLMLLDVMRVSLGLDSRHTDLDVKAIIAHQTFDSQSLQQFLATLDDQMTAVGQNVQDKMAYDALLLALARL